MYSSHTIYCGEIKLNRYHDWLMQASEDIKAANTSMENNHFEWACFQSQQSAEKALKALILALNIDAWSHGLVHLLKEWKRMTKKEQEELQKIDDVEFQGLLENCQDLDRHYIQPRYPNGFASGYPAEYYNQKIANESITYAENIISFVKKKIAKISSSE